MNRATIGALAAAALLAACNEAGDPADPGGSTGDQFARAEALAVIEAIVQVTEEGATITMEGGSPSAAGALPGTVTVEHESTHPCPTDGRIALEVIANLAYDEETESLDYDGTGTLTHEACSFPHDDVTIAVDGDPNLTFATQAEIAGGVPAPITQTVTGAFLWSTSDERGGRCVVDLSVVTDLVAKSRTVQGEVCEYTIDQTITWT